MAVEKRVAMMNESTLFVCGVATQYTDNGECNLKLSRKFTVEQLHSSDCRYDLCVWRPDCWLTVSVHQEGPAADLLDQGGPW